MRPFCPNALLRVDIRMPRLTLIAPAIAAVLLAACQTSPTAPRAAAVQNSPKLDAIQNIVVIFAENRAFDHLYGGFPGANGLQNLTPEQYLQRDRDGSVLKTLPPVPGSGLTD